MVVVSVVLVAVVVFFEEPHWKGHLVVHHYSPWVGHYYSLRGRFVDHCCP